MQLDQATPEQLRATEQELLSRYRSFQSSGLDLDLTRGKPSAEQLALSDRLDGILAGDYRDAAGTDLRNYGGVDGIPAAKELFGSILGVPAERVLVGGNSSLTLMYEAVLFALHHGALGPETAWAREGGPIRFLAPVPGYDRHFSVCEHLGIELLPVPLGKDGPDMDEVERCVSADPLVKGIWCVPRFSNPTGIVYGDEVVARMARLPKLAGPNFRVFWDNAYAVHELNEGAPQVANLLDACREVGTEDHVYLFGSTSKVTFAGAGVSFLAASEANLAALRSHIGFTSIGPDKINQERHVRLLRDRAGVAEHMRRHAEILRPRFDAVLGRLRDELAGTGMGAWTEPEGGYFVSFDTRPGLAREVVRLAGDAGVKLTPAGATFPYGNDPEDRNIRLSPTFPPLADIEAAMEVFVVCVQLASVRQRIAAA